jgi:protoheme IX farnesyltransferase
VAQALFYAVLMVPVSLWPFFLGVCGTPYAIAATLLSLGYLWYTIRFARIGFEGAGSNAASLHPDSPLRRMPARDLLRASVIYLPLLLAAMMLDARGRLLF